MKTLQARANCYQPLSDQSLQRFVSVADAILRCHLQTDWNCPQIKVLPAARKYIFSLACKLFLSVDDTKKVERLSKYSTGLLSMPINLPETTFNRAVPKDAQRGSRSHQSKEK